MTMDRRVPTRKTAKQLYEEFRQGPQRKRIGFGERCALINVDFQVGYMPLVPYAEPDQIERVNRLVALVRERSLPVVWTQNLHGPHMEDYGIRGLRVAGQAAAGGLIEGLETGDICADADFRREQDFVIKKRMPSGFFETHLQSLLTIRRIDTLIVTGGSTSGCVRATVVDAFSRGFRVVIPEECVGGHDESSHFAGIHDMALKYSDVISFEEVAEHLGNLPVPQ